MMIIVPDRKVSFGVVAKILFPGTILTVIPENAAYYFFQHTAQRQKGRRRMGELGEGEGEGEEEGEEEEEEEGKGKGKEKEKENG